MISEITPLQIGRGIMAVIYPHFLRSILRVHEALQEGEIPYPFFDPACIYYEVLRAVLVDQISVEKTLQKFGLTAHAYRKSLKAFWELGTIGLIGLDSHQITEELSPEVERMVYVLKTARSWIPSTKMSLILRGFGFDVPIALMRHLYASYGWAQGSKQYKQVDFVSLNLKVIRLDQLRSRPFSREDFFHDNDRLQSLLEVYRTFGTRGITKRYSGSRVSFKQHKNDFLSLGLIGLVDRSLPPFRNSKLGFKEEGWVILSKIQNPKKDETYYLKILESKRIHVDSTCIIKIFARWNVNAFQSQFKGDLERLLQPEAESTHQDDTLKPKFEAPSIVTPIRLDSGFVSFVKELDSKQVPLANPGIFLFLPYLNSLKLFEKSSSLIELNPEQGYSWFSLLLLNLGRILGGISSTWKACRTHELSFPLSGGLVAMPCKDSLLNGLAQIGESELLELRQYLTQSAFQHQLIEGKRVAFDFHMRDFTNEDVVLKNIGKGPSPKRQICFPGFRPHLAWDVETGTPISLEFRNGRARATTTIKRFVRELFHDNIGQQAIEHVYLDSEYTAEHVWRFFVDPEEGLGANLTMCIKQNKRVKKHINTFLETKPVWLFFDEDHTYSENTFEIPIQNTQKVLHCVLKRHETTGKLRCFGSTLQGIDARGILDEYDNRWIIENGIKDLIGNYFFDTIPGIDPHRINIHYFVITLARLLFEMLSHDYEDARNLDKTKKSIGTLRPEFMIGTNATLSRVHNELVLKWVDPYPEKQHQFLNNLFDKLNNVGRDGLPFLGGLQLKFDLAPPRDKNFRNIFKRVDVEF